MKTTRNNAETAHLQARFEAGLALHQSGRLAEAHEIYRQILKKQPGHLPSLQLLSMIAFDTMSFSQAVEWLDKAIAVNPNDARFWLGRGLALHEMKRWDEALASYEQAIRLKRDFAEAYFNRGVTLEERNRWKEALVCYNQAIQCRPDYAEAYINRGIALYHLKRFDEALASYSLLNGLDEYVQTHINRGMALHELKRYEEALACYGQAIQRSANAAEAYNNRGVTLQEIKRFDEALANYDQAIRLKEDYAEAHSNRGLALHELQRWDEALASCERAVALGPDDAVAHGNRGIVLKELGQLDAALASYDHAIRIMPNYADAYFNKSLVLLLTGNYASGLPFYEWRWKTEKSGLQQRYLNRPPWLGAEPLKDKTILLHHEQGLGDTLQFLRYVKLAADQGARVIVDVPQALHGLVKGMQGVSALVEPGMPPPAFDFHCPLLSLPLAFKTTPASIPLAKGYLHGDSSKTASWASRLGARTKPRVGLVWSSTSTFKSDSQRSLTLRQFLSALPDDGPEFICLQKEVKDMDASLLASRRDIRFFGNEMNDFTDTAALIDCVDVVVSTCTSVPHLSGAMGKPTWILLSHIPDWRWLLDRDDSPWYSSVKLYRQERLNDWSGVLARVRADLAAVALS